MSLPAAPGSGLKSEEVKRRHILPKALVVGIVAGLIASLPDNSPMVRIEPDRMARAPAVGRGARRIARHWRRRRRDRALARAAFRSRGGRKRYTPPPIGRAG